MTRIVEILIAVNAIAGIAAFLGLRHVVRSWFGIGDSKDETAPPPPPPKPQPNWKLRMLGAKPVDPEASEDAPSPRLPPRTFEDDDAER